MYQVTPRQILHIDMDAFFAAVEQLDHPELRGKPLLVGGDPKGRGVVSTASYEARPFGCHSAMPMAVALRLCPHAIVVRPRMDRYVEISQQVLGILEQFTPLVEPISIDEAFLDVTGSIRLLGPPEIMASELKQRIHASTNLTASVGVAPNKFLAKLASDLRKPDGLVVVAPDGVRDFLNPLPIARLWGVGKATLPRLERIGIHTFGEALRLSATDWRREFGDHGAHFHELVRGIDERPVVPDRAAKSISHEITFPVDIENHDYVRAVILDQTDAVAHRLRRHELLARTVSLKIRSGDFTTITRRATVPDATDQTEILWHAVSGLFETWAQQNPLPVRLIGVGAAQLSNRSCEQMSLFQGKLDERSTNLDRAMDAIRDRFGNNAISRAAQGIREQQ
ncbi:MAG: DNA polymerase IV [Planctomycetes bacterium]|nr:DNA polymerase IV [Planctomycetota bacterium]